MIYAFIILMVFLAILLCCVAWFKISHIILEREIQKIKDETMASLYEAAKAKKWYEMDRMCDEIIKESENIPSISVPLVDIDWKQEK